MESPRDANVAIDRRAAGGNAAVPTVTDPRICSQEKLGRSTIVALIEALAEEESAAAARFGETSSPSAWDIVAIPAEIANINQTPAGF